MLRPARQVPGIQCSHCPRKLNSRSGYTQHYNSQHRQLTPPPDEEREDDNSFTYRRHEVMTGTPCDAAGNPLPPFTPPPPRPQPPVGSFKPFDDRAAFDFAYLHFVQIKTSEANINDALGQWAATTFDPATETHGCPWSNAKELHATLDAIQQGGTPWKTYSISYTGPLPENPPRWMTQPFELCCRDTEQVLREQLDTSDFKDQIHYTPYMQFNATGKRVWSNVMSADWVWKQVDQYARDHPEQAPGTMFVPIVAGSDKTTVSVATGHQEYHPVYMSPGLLSNTARRSHSNGVLPVGFLPIPKVSPDEQGTPEFAKFARQLYHACLARIFAPLRAGAATPRVIRCPDGHFRRAVYGLGPYIADYPEQVYLAAIVQNWCPKCEAPSTNLDAPNPLLRSHARTDDLMAAYTKDVLWSDWGIRCDYTPFTYNFPRADIHELLSPDLLHQVIKGTFKDHIVTWVYEYLEIRHGKAKAKRIQRDIDRRIAAVPAFPGLRRFHEGRNFEQWTGDDSKALMKIFIACIVGYVPSRVVQCLSAFLDFCYIARQNSLSSDDLDKLDAALACFHEHRSVFIEGVRIDISLPRQHALTHYRHLIQLFGSPNGLCSSITESKHIIAVKKPWRASSRYNTLSQMLKRITREEKLEAARRDFTQRGMLQFSTLDYMSFIRKGGIPEPLDEADDDREDDDADDDLGPSEGPKVLSSISLARTPASGYPTTLRDLAIEINQPQLPAALRRFLWQRFNPESDRPSHTVPLDECPTVTSRIKVYHSAVARFFAPSDICGAGGMRSERIRSIPNWRNSYPRRDTVYVETDSELPGMQGMVIGRVFLFFSLQFRGETIPCAFMSWMVPVGDAPDPETGFWVVKPEFLGNQRSFAVVHLDCIVRGAHLLPVYDSKKPLSSTFHFSRSLDVFRAFFVNHFVDHHAHEFVS